MTIIVEELSELVLCETRRAITAFIEPLVQIIPDLLSVVLVNLKVLDVLFDGGLFIVSQSLDSLKEAIREFFRL